MRQINKYLLFNALILAIAFIIVFSVFIYLFSPNATPVNLKETTGAVTEFKHAERTLLDDILPPGADEPPYFKIWIDEKLYEAKGSICDSIDKKLFDVLSVGDEITIKYNEKSWGQGVDTIYNIEYNGVTYLSINDINVRTDEEIHTSRMICWLIIASTVIVATGLYVVNYIMHKRKEKSTNK